MAFAKFLIDFYYLSARNGLGCKSIPSHSLVCPLDILKSLYLGYRAAFSFNLFHTTLQILTRCPITLVHSRYEERCVREQVVHFLKRSLSGLREEAVEEDRVRQITDLG